MMVFRRSSSFAHALIRLFGTCQKLLAVTPALAVVGSCDSGTEASPIASSGGVAGASQPTAGTASSPGGAPSSLGGAPSSLGGAPSSLGGADPAAGAGTGGQTIEVGGAGPAGQAGAGVSESGASGQLADGSAGGASGAGANGWGGAPAAGQGGAAGHGAGQGGEAPRPIVTKQPDASCAVEGEPCAGYTIMGVPENVAGYNFPTRMVAMDGVTVHTWDIPGYPPKMLPGGDLIGCVGVTAGSYDCVEMRQVSWTGELEWSFSDWVNVGTDAATSRQHHDYQRQGNPVGYYVPGQDFVEQGTTLVLAHLNTEAPAIRDGTLEDDVIYEVNWDGSLSGFEWHGVDHVDEFGLDEAARNDIRTHDPDSSVFSWLHGNTLSRLGPNHWFDEGLSEFNPDNIIYSSRDANFVIIISYETGEVMWRIGPEYSSGPEASLGQFVGQHHPHMIPEGLPGAGNILIFDNGGSAGFGGTATTGTPNRYTRGYSRVLEFDPVTFDIVWEYGNPDAASEDFFYSFFVSSAQRLPNGNTLVAIGNESRIVEVTPDKRVVWRYAFAPETTSNVADWIYRAYRVPPEWLPPGENEALGDYMTWTTPSAGGAGGQGTTDSP